MRNVPQAAKDLSAYRFERAKEDLESAHNTYDSGEFRTANNRAYYAVFHALRAVLALDEYDSKKHSGIISEFRKRYIKTQIFESSVSDMIGDTFEIRNLSDYEDMYIVSKSATLIQIQNAEKVVKAVEEYLKAEKII